MPLWNATRPGGNEGIRRKLLRLDPGGKLEAISEQCLEHLAYLSAGGPRRCRGNYVKSIGIDPIRGVVDGVRPTDPIRRTKGHHQQKANGYVSAGQTLVRESDKRRTQACVALDRHGLEPHS